MYTVVSGDIMYSIAQKFGVKLADLIKANPQISDPNVIYPSDVLCLPGQIPSQLTLPCSVLLTPTAQIPSGIIANAIAYIGPTGNHTISIVSNLLAPSFLGNYSSYAAYIDNILSKPLYETTNEPTPSWASTIDLGTLKILPNIRLIISANQGDMSPPPGDHILFEGIFSCF
nr:LysM peptidoglycan-binding domain-containing protein [Desulfosporosinus meridiei]